MTQNNRTLLCIALLWSLASCPEPLRDDCEARNAYGDGFCDACPQLDPDCELTSEGEGEGQPADEYLLTPLFFRAQAPSNVQAHFFVTEAGVGVSTLAPDDFIITEDGAALDDAESEKQVRKREEQNGLVLPTVLLLDLSRSVIDAGALEQVKEAARQIVAAKQPEQTIQLVTFADNFTVRQSFTADAAALEAVIDAIVTEDGVSTNLYGSVIGGLQMWVDGFAGTALTIGMLIVVTDGADTAGVASLGQVLESRANKRVLTVGIGADIDIDALTQIGNAGVRFVSSFDDLATEVIGITADIQQLNDSIYFVSYCTPKRAGSHTLDIRPTRNADVPACGAATFSQAVADTCSVPGGGMCSETTCCDAAFPYSCPELNLCYDTVAGAVEDCAGFCVECGGQGAGTKAGTILKLRFNADGFTGGCVP